MNTLEALNRLWPADADATNVKDLETARIENDELICPVWELGFKVGLPLLAASLRDPVGPFEAQAILEKLTVALDTHPNFREFAWYSPCLLGRLDTGLERGSVKDLVARLRLATLLLQALDGHESYRETCRLLLRQRFLLLTAVRDPGYVPDPEGQVRAAQRRWAAEFLDRPEETALLLERYGCDDLEKEALWLAWKDGQVDNGLWDFARQHERDRAFSRHLGRRWFLRRYDLPHAADLVAGVARAKYPNRAGRVLAALFFGPWPGQVWLYPLLPAILLLAALLLAWIWPRTVIETSLMEAAAALAAFWVVLLLAGLCAWGSMALYPFATRLTAGITVGLIAWVAMPEAAHEFAFGAFQPAHRCAAAILATVALLSAGLYLFVETCNRVEKSARAAVRAGRVLVLGWAEALLLTAGLSAVGAGHLVKVPICGPAMPRIDVGIGHVYVAYTLFASVLALAVGVFVQILWEDKPITEPL